MQSTIPLGLNVYEVFRTNHQKFSAFTFRMHQWDAYPILNDGGCLMWLVTMSRLSCRLTVLHNATKIHTGPIESCWEIKLEPRSRMTSDNLNNNHQKYAEDCEKDFIKAFITYNCAFRES